MAFPQVACVIPPLRRARQPLSLSAPAVAAAHADTHTLSRYRTRPPGMFRLTRRLTPAPRSHTMHSAQNAARTSQMSRAGRLGGSGALRGDSLPTVQLRQRAFGAASNFPREMLWRRLRHGQKKEARGKLNHSCARFSQVPVLSAWKVTALRYALPVLWRTKKIGDATVWLARF